MMAILVCTECGRVPPLFDPMDQALPDPPFHLVLSCACGARTTHTIGALDFEGLTFIDPPDGGS